MHGSIEHVVLPQEKVAFEVSKRFLVLKNFFSNGNLQNSCF
jgi:hypothetical protein